jgi:hypothetical protein
MTDSTMPTPATSDPKAGAGTFESSTGDPDATVLPGADQPSADPRVDDALSRLAELDRLPLSEQVEVFTDIHRRLAAVLADPDSRAQ